MSEQSRTTQKAASRTNNHDFTQSQAAPDRAAAGTDGYEVTTSVTLEGTTDGCALITEVEAYIRAYVTLLDPSYALVIALWLTATHAWTEFDAFPYLVVTSTTKRSGKTRLLELLFFVASNSRMVADISPAALYHTIDAEKPTLLIDEAEKFSSANSEYRPLLNAGYRRGQTVKRHDGDYETYCPKAFALIGDVHDTLRDRSVAIEMRRGEPARRFVYAAAKEEGAAVREKLTAAVSSKVQEIAEEVGGFGGLPFLTDRDEEIWTPLFILCRLFCPERLDELKRTAADISAAKTAKAKRYTELGEQEDKAQEQEYAIRLLRDMVAVTGDRDQITTQEAIAKLREIPTSPWRRFRGDGLKDGIEGGMLVAGLLSQFGVKPTTIRIASKNVGTGSTAKGYKREVLLKALNEIEQARSAGVLEPVLATRLSGNKSAPENLLEDAERPVKPSLDDVAAQPNKQSGNLRVADEQLNAEEAKLIKPAPQFPVIRQGNESKLFTFLSEGRVDRKSMLDSVFGGIDDRSFLKHVRKFSQRICDKFHDGVYEVSVYSKNDRVVIDNAAYDKLVAEEAALPIAAKVKTVKPVVTDETPTTSLLEPDAEVISTTKVGDKSEPTRHGFYWEFVKDENPYAVRDLNNPNLGILHKLKSKAEADKYMNDREREAAACEEQSTARTAEKADGVSNTYCDDSSMVERPVQLGNGGSTPTSSLHFVRIEKALATELVIKHHYLHRKPLVSWAFGIIRDSQLVGVCTFGKPMWSVQVGVTGGALSDVRKNKGRWRDVFELNRLWIADDVTDHCIESKFVAWCLRELKKENPNLILISYADGSVTNSVTQKNHVGVVYQAGGWIYTGLSSPWVDITIEGKDHRSVPKKMQGDKIGNRRSWAGVNVERKKRSRKHRYVKFLNPKDVGLLAWKRGPRPRNAV